MTWDAAARRKYYYKNREKCLAWAKGYRERNKEKVYTASLKWRENNPEKVREYGRKYNEKRRWKKEEEEWNNTLIELGYSDLVRNN